jgi:hypothetical protein
MKTVPAYLKQSWPKERQFLRRKQEVSLKLTCSEGRQYRGWCKDIGEGGVGATIAVPLHVGAEVMLDFQVPDCPEPLKVRAAVRYSKQFCHGFEFVTLTPEQREVIRRYLEAQVQARQSKTSAIPLKSPK